MDTLEMATAPDQRKGMHRSIQRAWERMREDFKADAEWRAAAMLEAAKPDIDELSRYEDSEVINESLAWLDVTFISRAPDAVGQARGWCESGDVFEHAKTMVRLGDEALRSLLDSVGAYEAGSSSASDVEEEATEGVCAVRMSVNATLLSMTWPEDHSALSDEAVGDREDDRPPPQPPHSEAVGRVALERIMVGYEVKDREQQPSVRSHDWDLVDSGSGAIRGRVECTQATSQTGETWTKSHPRLVRGSRRLKFEWRVSVHRKNPLGPEWEEVESDEEKRKARSAAIEKSLLDRAKWSETQMGTPRGASNLANRRERPQRGNPLREYDASAEFKVYEPQGGGHGCLKVGYGGSSGWFSSGGPSTAAKEINKRIAEKADKNQAGVHKGDSKWLVVYLNPLHRTGIIEEIRLRLLDPPSWPEFASELDLKHFEEVWIVWEPHQTLKSPPFERHPLNVIICRQHELPRYVLAASQECEAEI